MLNKKLIILTIFFVSLLAVSAVSAADNATDDVVSVEESDEVVSISDNDVNNTVISNENDDVLAVEDQEDIGVIEENELSATAGTFTDLANDIENAGDELELTRDYIYSSEDSDYEQGIIINKKITINGNGFIINGNNQARALSIKYDNVIINDVSFVNCNASSSSSSNGGAVNWLGESGVLGNCSFVNCSSRSYGGAVYWYDEYGVLGNCSFVNCSSSSSGGAVYLSELSFRCVLGNSSFVNCSSSSSGGAVYWESYRGVITNCSFADNAANRDGGAVCWTDESCVLGNCSFVNCYSSRRGGAVYSLGESGVLGNCSFVNCKISSSSVYSYGGAVYSLGESCVLGNCSFVNCSSISSGGAVYCGGSNGVLGNCSFVNCYSSNEGGAVYWVGSNGVLGNSSFVNCSASSISSSISSSAYGGAVYWHGKSGVLGNCSFVNCSVSPSSYSIGGAIYWYGESGVLGNCSFVNCSSISCGGAVNWFGESGVLGNCSFVNCKISSSSALYGGAVHWDSSNGVLGNCSFVNCSNRGYGGAVYWNIYARNGVLFNCSFVNCSSIRHGGAVYWGGSNGVLGNCSFVNCSSRGYGGAVYWNGESGVLGNCSFNGDKYNYGLYCYAVYKFDSNLNVDVNNSLSKITVNPIVNNVTITIMDVDMDGAIHKQYNLHISDCYELFLNDLPRGTYSITVEHLGDDFYASNSIIKNFMAPGITPKFNVTEIDDIVAGGDFIYNVTLNNDAMGTVKIILHDSIFENNVVNGSASINITNIIGGSYEYLVEYSGYSKYNGFTLIKIANVSFKNSTIDFIVPHMIFGKNGIICPVVNSDATGNLTVYIDNTYYATLNVGENFTIGNLTVGNHTVKGVYNGDNYYNVCEKTRIFEVDKINTTILVSHDRLIAGDTVLNIILNNETTGTVIINVTGKKYNATVSNGKAKIIINDLTSNYYNYTVIYSGDNNFNPNIKEGSFHIQPKESNINISSNSICVGDNAKISYNITEGTTGNIGIFLNNAFVKNITVGQEVTLSILSPGKYQLKLIYYSDGFYATCENTTNITVFKYTSIKLDSYEINFNEELTINPIITAGATGGLDIYLNNSYKTSIPIGSSYSINGLNADDYTLKVVYSGNEYYYPCENTTSLKVNKINTILYVFPTKVIAGGTVLSVTLNNKTTGTITVNVNNKKYTETISNGKATVYIYDLPEGDYDYTVTYNGDQNFNKNVINDSLSIRVKQSNIQIYSEDIFADELVMIYYTLTSGATGVLSVYVNDVFVKNISVGSAINLGYLDEGNYTIKVVYNSDGYYATCEDSVHMAVKIHLTDLKINANDIYVSDVAKINYDLTDGATGFLSVYVNDVFVKNVSVGQDIELKNLAFGSYTVKVVYNGDGYYAPCQNVTSFNVRKLTPSFDFTMNDAIAGNNFVITYILNQDATGTVKCNDSTMRLVNGKANSTINNIKAGLYKFNISYSGDGKYNPIRKSINVNIKFKDAIVDFDVRDIIWGDTLTIAPTVPNGATGYLNIYIDNNLNSTINIGGRKDFTFYTWGYHSIKVTYSGDEYYSPNSTTKGFNVIRLNSTCDIKGNIEVDNSASVYVTLNDDATGKVSITVNGNKYTCNLVEGLATFRVPNLPADTYNVLIDYEGDSKYNSIYTTKSLEVTLKPSNITLNVKNIIYGNSLVITPIVTSSASGTLKIYVDNVLKTTIDIGSSYTITNPSTGKHDVRVVYNGDSYHQGNEAKTSFRVFTFYPIEVQNTAIIYGMDNHFQAIFYDEYGNVAANKLVAFRVNGEDTVVMSDANGLAVFNKDLPIGTYTVTVINAYVSEEHNYNLKVFTSIESEDMTRAYNTGIDFKVRLLDENADTLSNGYAMFKVNNKDYPVMADNNGIAVLNANLPTGTYTVTTTNGRTGETKTNKITIVPSVNADNMVRGYNSGVDFRAQFLDADAKPLINQKVAFIIDNTEYEVTTDSNGYAVLNEQLDVGEYEVTIANKVTGEIAIRNLTIVERIVENNDVIRISGEESYYTIRVIGDDGNFVGANEIVNININNIDYQIRTNNNGYASFRIDENIGSYDIFAEYKGYEVYNDVYVLERVNYISNLNITNINYKENALINLTLSSFDSNAYVEFEVVDDNEYMEVFDQSAKSTIILPITGLNAGKYTVTANYYDLNTYKFSSIIKTFNVNKINPKIIIAVENANVSEIATITVNIPNVEGNVEINVGNALTFNEYLVKNGVIIKEIDSLPAGVYNVYVNYKGNNNYNAFTESAVLTIVQPKLLTSFNVADIATTQGIGANLIFTLKDELGNILVGKGVSILFNGVNSILTTDKNGQANLAIEGNLAPDTYIATITFVGDDSYVGSTATAKVTVNKQTTPAKPVTKTTLTLKKVKVKRFAKKLTIQATLKVNGKAVKGKIIKFKFNKKTYKAKTNAKGVAKITVKKSFFKKLKKGKKVTYTATYDKITKKVTVKVK